MAAPNHLHIVQDVFASRDWQLGTHDGVARFTEAAVQALHQYDKRWGHLRKDPNRTHINGRSEDSALYLEPSGLLQSVDFLKDAGLATATPVWQPDTPRYSHRDWIDPDDPTQYSPVPGWTGAPGPTPQPVPVPVPTPTCVCDLTPILTRLDQLAAAVVALSNRPLPTIDLDTSGLEAVLRTVGERIEVAITLAERAAAASENAPVYEGSTKAFGGSVTLRPRR